MWGGCMLFRAAEVRHDARGILQVGSAPLLGPRCPGGSRHPAPVSPTRSAPVRGVEYTLFACPSEGRQPPVQPKPRPQPIPPRQRPFPDNCPPAHPTSGGANNALPLFRPPPTHNTHLVSPLQAWQDGGYSDDLTVASKCTELGLVIYCPGYSIFPQWWVGCALLAAPCSRSVNPAALLSSAAFRRAVATAWLLPPCRLDGAYSPRRWWNYLRRQLYVMDTYSNPHNRQARRCNCLLRCVLGCFKVMREGFGPACLQKWPARRGMHRLGGPEEPAGNGNASSARLRLVNVRM